jgi:hypothetical protein
VGRLDIEDQRDRALDAFQLLIVQITESLDETPN